VPDPVSEAPGPITGLSDPLSCYNDESDINNSISDCCNDDFQYQSTNTDPESESEEEIDDCEIIMVEKKDRTICRIECNKRTECSPCQHVNRCLAMQFSDFIIQHHHMTIRHIRDVFYKSKAAEEYCISEHKGDISSYLILSFHLL
jgi:hypothetical protein